VLPPGRLNNRGTHSCDPNLWWIEEVTLASRRDIDRAEELTNDYGTSSGSTNFRVESGCGSRLCRRAIAGDDWRLPELQARYADHWVPVLLRRIRAQPPGRP
jgi:hypothetical protein